MALPGLAVWTLAAAAGTNTGQGDWLELAGAEPHPSGFPRIDPWVMQARLDASDGAPSFGRAVATGGEFMAVGAPAATVDGNTDQGAVYLFQHQHGLWLDRGRLIASDGGAGDQFGIAVALDGNTLLVGAGTAEVDGNANQGAAYVFVRDGEQWVEQARLVDPAGAASDRFGMAVAVDGDSVLVGRLMNMGGAADVFVREQESWIHQSRLTASDGAGRTRFGESVALLGDVAVVGAPGSTVGLNSGQGAAYVYRRSDGDWTEEAKLLASNGGLSHQFGTAVAVADDTVMAGALRAADGAVYVYTHDQGEWEEIQILVASDGELQANRFGNAVAMDGDVAVIGAPTAFVDGTTWQGISYAFVLDGTNWVEQARLIAPDGGQNHQQGLNVALSGSRAVTGSLAGAAYVFEQLPPDAVHITGTVRSLTCGDQAVPLSGALVEVTGSDGAHTVLAGPGGVYSVHLAATESPVTVAVTAAEHVPETEVDVVLEAGDTLVLEFDLLREAPCISATPSSLASEVVQGQAADLVLNIGNAAGETPLTWSALTGMTGAPAFARLVDCDAQPGLLINDDGSVENGYTGDPQFVTETIAVDYFLPATYPTTFTAVCIALLTMGPSSLDFEIVAFADDGPAGQPGTELGVLPVSASGIATTLGAPSWFSFDLSPLGLTLETGGIYVGMRWVAASPGVFIAADQSPGNPPGTGGGYWWDDLNGWVPLGAGFPEYRALMVRPMEDLGGCIDPGEVSWLDVTPDGGDLAAGKTMDIQVSVDAANLDPGRYRSTVCLYSNDPVRPILAVPVVIDVLQPDPAELNVQPIKLVFEDTVVGGVRTATVSIGNVAESPTAESLNLSALGLSGNTAFSISGGSCQLGIVLAAGEHCELEILFAPVVPGLAAGGLQVQSTDGQGTVVGIAGNALKPHDQLFQDRFE